MNLIQDWNTEVCVETFVVILVWHYLRLRLDSLFPLFNLRLGLHDVLRQVPGIHSRLDASLQDEVVDTDAGDNEVGDPVKRNADLIREKDCYK